MTELLLVAGRDPRDEVSGGHSSYVRAHALAARKAGFVPHLFCADVSAAEEETDFGVVHRVFTPVRPVRQQAVALHGPLLVRSVVGFARSRPGPHLIHGFGVWGDVAVVAARRLGRAGTEAIPLASSYTTYADEARSQVAGVGLTYGRLMRWRYGARHLVRRLMIAPFERRAYLGARVVLCNYESTRRLLVGTYGKRVRTRRTLYGPPSAFAAAPGPAGPPPGLDGLAPAEAPLVVSVSRHQPRKGIDVLLRALGALRDRGVPFRACLAGDGELLDEHRALAFRLGLASSVLVAGALPSVAGLLSKGDLFVLPSRREQSGSLALLEALQAGIPAVASACDGIPEDVVHGESAWLVPPGDAGALADAIADLLADEGQRDRLSRGGREAFAARFSAEAFSRDLACAYAELGFIP